MPFGLSEISYQKLQNLFSQYPQIEQVIIYGSRARGDFRAGSDIDLTLLGDQLNESLRQQIACQIDELNTPYLFDLSLFVELTNQELIANIEREGIVFYKRKPIA